MNQSNGLMTKNSQAKDFQKCFRGGEKEKMRSLAGNIVVKSIILKVKKEV